MNHQKWISIHDLRDIQIYYGYTDYAGYNRLISDSKNRWYFQLHSNVYSNKLFGPFTTKDKADKYLKAYDGIYNSI